MRFVDDEFLLLSRSGRVSRGLDKRVARALLADEARGESTAPRKRRLPHPSRVPSPKPSRPEPAPPKHTGHRAYPTR
jgi:hypothetical protein